MRRQSRPFGFEAEVHLGETGRKAAGAKVGFGLFETAGGGGVGREAGERLAGLDPVALGDLDLLDAVTGALAPPFATDSWTQKKSVGIQPDPDAYFERY